MRQQRILFNSFPSKMLNLTILLLMVFSSTAYTLPATPSFVVATPGPEPSSHVEVTSYRPGLIVYKLHVTSNVTNRFAHTLINSKVKNYEANAAEAVFSVIIPETAYISGFLLEVDGKRYEAYVKEKEEAQNIYKQAVSGGRSAAHVAAVRDSNRFEVSVNIASGKKASFYMTYEELLQRRDNHYEIILNINPGQPVKDLRTEVNIAESKPLRFVKAVPIRSGNTLVQPDEAHLDPRATVFHINNATASVVFKPNIRRQKQLAHNLGTDENFGLSGQFIVQYDVVRDDPGGEVLLQDGYFVHFYAPPDLPPLPKQVVFVLDTSGSMEGTKLEQLKAAMYTILQELNENDTFSFVEFESVIRVWNLDQTSVTVDWRTDLKKLQLPPSFPVDTENVEKAWQIVDSFQSQTTTNIYTALMVALRIVELEETKNKANYLQPLIIFLTDGEPTEGITDTATIIKDITLANKFHTPIYTLSFGDGADKRFLQTLSLKNKAFSRYIYESADASLQLEDFYRHISSPLLTNVKFKYTSNVTDLTRSEFPVLYGGSEVVITGKTDGQLNPTVEANGYGGLIDVSPKISRPVNQIERLWAYLTVKQLLEDKEIVEDDEKKVLEEDALNLSKKFGFVTPVSSLVVEKPDGTDQTVDVVPADKAEEIAPSLQPSEDDKNENSTTTEVTRVASVNAIEKLQADLPWLKKVVGLKNDTIVFSKGEFPLGIGISIPEGPFCLHTPMSSLPGMCQLLHECPVVHEFLTNVFIFKQYFCQLQGYAGVCCPY